MTSFSFRPLTKKGTEKFGALLAATDWSAIKKSNSSDSTLALTNLLDGYVQECFPLKTRRAAKNDVPWFNSKTRRLSAKKKRIYKKEGKSERYKAANKEYNAALKEAKGKFMDGIVEGCKKAKNSRGFFKTVKLFQTKEAPIP